MRKYQLLTVALLIAGLAVTAVAQKPTADLPVTVTIDGLGPNTVPALRIQSDQRGPYKNSKALQSIVQGIGDWELDMLNFTSSPQRTALIDLRDPVPGSGPNGSAPFNPMGPNGYQQVRARFIAKCSQNGINMRNMLVNTPYFCPLAIAFDVAGVRYRLNLNPSNFPGVDWVQITCLATDSTSKCTQWKIEPSVTQSNGERKVVSKLLKVATSNKQTDQDMGNFYLSFSIQLTNP